MRAAKRYFLFLFILFSSLLYAQRSPDVLYADLFVQVQMQQVFEDSKTFPDCIPLFPAEEILKNYEEQKIKPDFNLEKFVLDHFRLPKTARQEFVSDISLSPITHIERLWPILTRNPDSVSKGSLIVLPYKYVVPGGRFREIYYWDSYFTMLGLQYSKRPELIRRMIDNFSFLIDSLGFIPNGNRSYYLSRSQPPFYSLMIRLLADIKGKEIIRQYLPYLEKEYQFWMQGEDSLDKYQAWKRVVKLKDGNILNRYWDDNPVPRPESYREDVLLASKYAGNSEELYRNIRAACESGWDFSSRWLKDEKNLETIHTTEIVPIDLNCLLYHLEITLAEGYELEEKIEKNNFYEAKANKRKKAIIKYCWNSREKFFMDYDLKTRQSTNIKSLAATYPLFFQISKKSQAKSIKNTIVEDFVKDGGAVTTLNETNQQWDAPNGWAPLQWILAKGLLNYGFRKEAKNIADKWLHLNTQIYYQNGKMLEKYNVADTKLKGGGGEYALQDGFGWTNGVFIILSKTFK